MTSPAETAQGQALRKFFEQAVAPKPGSGPILAIRSTSATGLTAFDPARLVCLQTNRNHADGLERAGLRVVTDPAGSFELCVVEATRDRDENLYHLALAWSLLVPGGTLVLSAANALGGESLAKRIREAQLPVVAVYSKAKCRVIALSRSAGATPPPEWLTLGEFREIPGTGLVAGPGMFSAHALDTGTQVLCDALDAPLAGCGADFGAGYGALSHHVLERSQQIRSLALYEAEWKALAAAKRNLATWEDRVALRYLWRDLTTTVTEPAYDWIIMNPPFHSGQATEPALGQRFIATAASSLNDRGTLWLVANRHLPYEAVLKARFKRVDDLGQADGYKVYRATDPTRDRASARPGRPPPRRNRLRSG